MIDADHLGAKGEARFAELCEDVQLTCNKSNRDKTGWDFIVEYNFTNDGRPPAVLETRKPPISSHIQVKTLHEKNDRIQMRLSSAERLAKEPKPAFIVVFKVNDKLEFVDAYLIHLLDDPLATILKRLRKADAQGVKVTNKLTISMSAQRDGVRIALTGAALRDAIAAASGADMHAYISKKQEQMAKLGFDERPIKLRLSLQLGNEAEAVDAFLGLKKDIPGSNVRVSEVRFGIELPVEHGNDTGDAKFTITPSPNDQCTITVRGEPPFKPAVFQGEIFLPAIPGLPKDLQKALVKSDLFSITIQKGSWTLSSPGEDFPPQTPSAWADYWRLCWIMAIGSGTFEIASRSRPLQMNLDLAEGLSTLSASHCNGWITLCGQLHEVLEFAGVRDEPKVTLEEMRDYGNQIDAVHALVSPSNGMPKFSFVTGVDDALTKSLDTEVTYVDFLPVGDRTLGYYCTARMTGTRGEENVTWNATLMSLRGMTVLQDFPAKFDQFVERAKKATGIDNAIVRFPSDEVSSP